MVYLRKLGELGDVNLLVTFLTTSKSETECGKMKTETGFKPQ